MVQYLWEFLQVLDLTSAIFYMLILPVVSVVMSTIHLHLFMNIMFARPVVLSNA